MSVSEPGKIIIPWAESGLKNPIPPAANPATGRAGFDQGFSAINMTAKEAGGIPPFGQDFNGIFYEVTNILRYMQAGGQPTFDAALATAIGGYPKGAMVLGSDGLTLWQSKVGSNSTDPNTDPSDWGTFDIGLKEDLALPSGAGLVGGLPVFVTATKYAGGASTASVNNDAAITAAIADAITTGNDVYWHQVYEVQGNIPNFHTVRHIGPGGIKRGAETWLATPSRITMRKLFVSPVGSDTNDGLSASFPRKTLQGAVDVVNKYGPIIGRQQIIGASGVYSENVVIPDGICLENYYLEFKFPSDPGVRGDPNSWPVSGAVLNGTGKSGNGIETGRYNKVYIEYLLIRDWYNPALSANAQVVRGINVGDSSALYVNGVSAIGNGFENIGVSPGGSAVITGGILDGARYSVDATAGRVSFTAVEGVSYTTIRNAREYGLYVKHNASAVLDYTEFLDCGTTPEAVSYGTALFAYKTGASIDTRGCVFKRNNIVYNARGGFISTHPGIPDVIGTGVDANARIWLLKGNGSSDLIDTLETNCARDISRRFGSGSVTGVLARAYDSLTTIPAGYLTSQDQFAEFEVYAFNGGAAGTAQIRPSLVSLGGTRYELGNFQVAPTTGAYINLKVQVSSGGTVATVLYFNNGATVAGATTGQIIVNPIPFNSEDLRFEVWGDTSSTNTLSVRKARVILWG